MTLATLALSIILLGVGCFGPNVQIVPITLEYWRIDDSPDVMDPVIEAYRKEHPNVTINVRSFRADKYEQSLLEALAEDRGPDLFTIPNVMLNAWKAKLLPLPETTVIPTQVVDPNKKEIVAVNQETKSLTKLELKNSYVEAVENDVIMLSIPENSEERPTEKIFGLPYSVDTLAMFYNAALLRKANIEEPPVSWKGLQDQTKQLTVLDKEDDDIETSGAAIGTARNVRHHTDILTAIMLQNGAIMTDEAGRISFSRQPPNHEGLYPPGVEALIFYQSFGRPGLSTYTWDNSLPDSMDAFVAGKTVYYFGYPYDRIEIQQRAPQLDFGVTQLPQIDGSNTHNVAHYPVEVVSKKTAHPNEAWDFIQFAASSEGVREFLRATDRPTALRSLITEQITDPEAKPFVSQVLTAETWYRGKNWSAVEDAFAKMIETYPTVENPDYLPIVARSVDEVEDSYR